MLNESRIFEPSYYLPINVIRAGAFDAAHLHGAVVLVSNKGASTRTKCGSAKFSGRRLPTGLLGLRRIVKAVTRGDATSALAPAR